MKSSNTKTIDIDRHLWGVLLLQVIFFSILAFLAIYQWIPSFDGFGLIFAERTALVEWYIDVARVLREYYVFWGYLALLSVLLYRTSGRRKLIWFNVLHVLWIIGLVGFHVYTLFIYPFIPKGGKLKFFSEEVYHVLYEEQVDTKDLSEFEFVYPGSAGQKKESTWMGTNRMLRPHRLDIHLPEGTKINSPSRHIRFTHAENGIKNFFFFPLLEPVSYETLKKKIEQRVEQWDLKFKPERNKTAYQNFMASEKKDEKYSVCPNDERYFVGRIPEETSVKLEFRTYCEHEMGWFYTVHVKLDDKQLHSKVTGKTKLSKSSDLPLYELNFPGTREQFENKDWDWLDRDYSSQWIYDAYQFQLTLPNGTKLTSLSEESNLDVSEKGITYIKISPLLAYVTPPPKTRNL